MEMEKKNLAIIILAVVLAASGVGNVILGISAGAFKVPEEKNVLKIGTTEGSSPAVLDPVDSWDSVSNDVIAHVCDTLWAYDLYGGDYDIEMTLATNYSWNVAQDELTVDLRDDVYFHDGDKFDADDVKFTFDRILYFINVTGSLPSTSHVADPASLFYDMRGNCVLNETVVVDTYRVKFVLYGPNAIFVPLLAYRAWSILSDGGSTEATEYLTLADDILVGTGPFEYVHLIAGEELKFKRFDLYWGPSTFWDEIIWVFYPDTVTAGNALLGKEVHRGTFTTSMIAQIEADPDLVFNNLETSFIYRYFGLNNRKINNTNIRKAIAYAYNYTYFIEVVRLGYAIRATHFLPPGFPYYNASFTSSSYDTGIARQAMIDGCTELGMTTEIAGLTADPYGFDAGNDAAWAAANLFTFDILEHQGVQFIIEMNIAFANDMEKIGINVVPDVMDWETYIWVSTHNEDRLEIWYTGWGPDYMDPFNMIEPLLSNLSSANHIQLQDSQIMAWLTEYQETLPTEPADNPVLFENKKAELLYWIQNRALNVLYVELAVSYDMVMYGHHVSLGNVCYNIKRDLWCRDSFLIPGVPSI
ncbi:MAG: ABC transporter substrate-binding protein [Promethearchaeota archaeon]